MCTEVPSLMSRNVHNMRLNCKKRHEPKMILLKHFLIDSNKDCQLDFKLLMWDALR